VIRRIFKDIGNLELSENWFKLESDLQFTYDLITALILFFLIQQFYKNLNKQALKQLDKSSGDELKVKKFIALKRFIAAMLIPTVIFLALFSFFNWIVPLAQNNWNDINSFKKINNVFFEDFFILLIIIDVILLLFSFFYSDSFHKIIRNSGFVISTILIKISFSMDGIINNALILGAVLFGFFILLIHNSFHNYNSTES
jgi:hypothetical protein